MNDLRLLFWETTAGCNLECVHCRRLDVSRQLMNNDLTFDESLRFVEHLASFAKPILVLSGGEPLCRPDNFQKLRDVDQLEGNYVAEEPSCVYEPRRMQHAELEAI